MEHSRCINCALFLDHRLRKIDINNASEAMVDLLRIWIHPIQVSNWQYLCEACFTILQTEASKENPQRSFGHKLVCLGCGISVLRIKSYLLQEDSFERNTMLSWISNLQTHHLNRSCNACWKRAQRMPVESAQVEEIQRRPVESAQVEEIQEYNASTREQGVNTEEPEVAEVGIQHEEPAVPQIIQRPAAMIRLHNYKRIANTSRHCAFTGCRNPANTFLLIPAFIKQRMLSQLNVYIPRSARICNEHLNGNWRDLSNSANIDVFTSDQIEDLIHLTKKPVQFLYFEEVNEINETLCRIFLGRDVYQFENIYNETPSLHPLIKESKTALATYLAKLRTGDPDEKLAAYFNIAKSTLQRYMKIVRTCLLMDYVPQHLNVHHMTVQDVSRRNLAIPEGLFINHETETNERPAIVICDGTYIYTQKSSNYKYQKRTYSLHKYRNLVKPFLFVCSDGYILHITGPHSATESDATIMSNLFIDEESEMNSYFRKGDIFIVDRGFRDVVPLLEARGFKVFMPETIDQGNFQLSTIQANKTRFVTLVRWVVEIVNGRFKRDFKLFRQDYFNNASPHLMDDFLIAGAILNHFHPLLTDREDADLILLRAIDRLHLPNTLGEYVQGNNLNRHRVNFTSINGELPQLNYFPKLSQAHLILIALGTYQIKQSVSYFGEHIRENGLFTVEVNSEVERANDPNLNGTIIRGKIQSRHTSRKTYFTYILFNNDFNDEGENDENNIVGYYCNCKAGNRTVGCCAHVMTIIWFLGWARYDPERQNVPAQSLDSILLNYDDDMDE